MGYIVRRTMRTLVASLERSGAPGPSAAWRSVALRYSAAVGAVIVAGTAHTWLERFGSLPPFITFSPTVLLVAILAGGGPGILATLLSAAMADYLWFPPFRTYSLPMRATDWIAMAIFIGMSLLMCLIAERLRRAGRGERATRIEKERAAREIQQLYDQVHAEKERLSLVLSTITDEVYFTDTEGRYVFANQAALREFGHRSVEGIDVKKVISHIIVLRADGTPRPMEEAPPLRALAGEVIRDEEQIVRTPRTGELRHRQVNSAPVRDASGKIIGSVSVVRDITERKRTEAAMREADRRKNVFLATLSHELRNPLAPIRTAVRLLDSPAVSEVDLKRCQAILSRQVAHMASLLDDLLDVSRLTRGELTLKKACVPLRGLLDNAVETAQPLINARRHRLQIELPPGQHALDVDPVRFTQVISNLLTNAAKYTRIGGHITLGSRLEPQSLVIFVRDTGIGVPQEMYTEIFKMFVQAEPGHERAEGGLGIGLALVKALVELHGGRIEVQSAGRDRGSTFTVTLPRSVIVTNPAPAAATPAGEPAQKVGPRRVLVADDNEDGADLLATLLRLSGHEVHIAHDGAEALETATRVQPHVALLDIGMPGLNGYEVAERIRREPWGKQMLLVAVTGWGQEEDKRRARAAGFNHHLTKPMDPMQLDSIFASDPAPPPA